MTDIGADTKKTFLEKAVGILHDTWWGAFAFFVVMGLALFVLQMMLSGLLPWPKEVHALLLFALWANVGVSMIVSLSRRKFGRAATQLAFVVVGFFIYVFAVFCSYCVPTRMTASPGEKWIQEFICKPTHIERSQLVFLGGIDMREQVVVFEVLGELPSPECFKPGSPFCRDDKARMRDHYRHLMEACRVAVELPEEFDVSYCHDEYYSCLSILSAGGKTYLAYERN